MINVKMPRKRCFRGIFVGKEMMLFWWILWEEAYWNVQKPQQDIWG